MTLEDKINTIFNFMSNTIIFGYFCFTALLILLVTLYFLELPSIDEISILKYAEVFVTFILVGITAIYAYDNNRMVKQSKSTQEIYYIQERLEKFYYPLLNTLPSIITYKEDKLNNNSVKLLPISRLDQHDWCMSNLEPLVKYQYLAFQETKTLFESFMKTMNDYRYASGVTDEQIIDSRTKLADFIKNDIACLENELDEMFN